MNQQQRLIVALADNCGDETRTKFKDVDIAVIAWRRFPKHFSITGYPYPDTKKISVILAGNGRYWPLEKWLRRVEPGRYSLTEEGVNEATRLRSLEST